MSQENKNEKENKFLSVIASKTHFPCDLAAGEFRLELRGRSELYICGCKKILKYGEDEMVIRAKSFDVVISGDKLSCASFHCSGVVVEGDIKNICLESKP